MKRRSPPPCDPRYGWTRGVGKCVRSTPSTQSPSPSEEIILRAHQERVRERLRSQDGLILDHGLGSGKTISAIAAAEDYGGAVVVTPAALRDNFKKELKTYGAKGKYDVMSFEEFIRDRPDLSGRFLIVDEAHRLANSSALRTQAVSEAASKASKRLLLTATPLQNKPHNASTLVNIAAGEKILPVNESDFRRQYLKPAGGMFRQAAVYGNYEAKNLRDYRKKVSRYIDFYAPDREGYPTVAKHVINVPMSEAQARAQEAWLKKIPPDMKRRIKEGLPPSSGDVSRLNVFMNASRQTSNTGAAYRAVDEEISPKISAIVSRVSDSQGKSLVYSNYLTSGVSPLEKSLAAKGVKSARLTGDLSTAQRTQIVKDFNNDKIKTLIVSSAGGEGLDLKKVEQIHIMEPHWNEEKINQVVGRGVRYRSHEGLPENRRHVDVFQYVSVFPRSYKNFWRRSGSLKTADEYLSDLSAKKKQLNQSFLDSYRGKSRRDAMFTGFRLDRKIPAKCDPDHGWKRGIGKCVRSSPAKEERTVRRSSRTGAVAAITGVAAVGLAATVALQINRDIERSAVDFNSIRRPPGGFPDDLTFAKYDTFEPGDLIRRNFKSPSMGTRQHYAVYVGKDPNTGEHMCIETWTDHKNRDNIPIVLKRGLVWDMHPENDSEWEKVPKSDMNLVKGTESFSREEVVKRAEAMLHAPFEYRGFKSNCESFARGIVEGNAYSSQGLKNSPITNFISEFVTHYSLFPRIRPLPGSPQEAAFNTQSEKTKLIIPNIGIYDQIPNVGAGGIGNKKLEVTGFSDYATSQSKMTAQEMVRFLRRQEILDRRRQSWDWIPSPYTGEIENSATRGLKKMGIPVPQSREEIESVLKAAQARNGRKDSAAIDDLVESVGMKSPDTYWQELLQRLTPARASNLYSELLRQGVQDYLEVFFGVFRSEPSRRRDSYRIDRRPRAKCDPEHGWEQGPGGKCIRKKPKDEPPGAIPGKQTAATLARYEVNPATGRPYKIRELREVAREKGVVGYGSMTTEQMKSAMRLIDDNPSEAQQRNLVKTFAKDRSVSNRALGAGLGGMKGKTPAQRKVIAAAKDANLTYKNLEALMRFAGTAPPKWGALAAVAWLGGQTISRWEKTKTDYRNGLEESAKIAQARAPNVNVRHSSPSNPSGQYFTRSKSADGKRTGTENVTFVVGGGQSASSTEMLKELRREGVDGSRLTSGDDWLAKNNFVPFDLKESRVMGTGDSLDEATRSLGDFVRNRKRGRNQDAVDLASSMFAHAMAYPEKKLNVVAHGAGGLATKEALEILSRMEVKKGNRVIKGVDLVRRVNVVMLGTPHFGYTESVAPNTRTIASAQDPISRLPIVGAGLRPQWISSVKGHSPKEYLSDPSVREALRESFGYYRAD